VAGPVAGPGQGLLRDRPGRSLVIAGGTRDERERPGPALPGLLALAVATTATLVVTRRATRLAGHRAIAAAARAPPPLRPAAS
jgi:hypothetical protein